MRHGLAQAHQLHTAEQVRLLLRLAADTGARRGELDALQVHDLHGRVLHLDRGVSAEIVTTTKTNRTRRVTLGAGTTELWHNTLTTWRTRLPAGQEGKTEAIRCLKRYIAREVFNALPRQALC